MVDCGARGGLYERAAKIGGALDLTVRVLAASTEKSVDLSGPCHIALKVPSGNEFGHADIIVMPTTRQEQKLIAAIEAGKESLPDGLRTAAALCDALVRINRPALPQAAS